MKIIKLPAVIAMTGLSRSAIYAKIKEKKFPQQIHLSVRSCGWLSEEIESWIAQRAKARCQR